jgi:hypothetical protein
MTNPYEVMKELTRNNSKIDKEFTFILLTNLILMIKLKMN